MPPSAVGRERGEDVAEGREGGGLALVADLAGAGGVVQAQDCGLLPWTGRPEGGWMEGVAVEAGRPALVGLGEHAHGVAVLDQGGGVATGDAGRDAVDRAFDPGDAESARLGGAGRRGAGQHLEGPASGEFHRWHTEQWVGAPWSRWQLTQKPMSMDLALATTAMSPTWPWQTSQATPRVTWGAWEK